MQALADPCRLQIVLALKEADERGLACNEFQLNVFKATASHHFEWLRSTELIESQSEGVKCLSSLGENELNERFPGLFAAEVYIKRYDY